MNFDRISMRILLLGLPRLFIFVLMLAGCASQGTHPIAPPDSEIADAARREVRSGDMAAVHYLCRLRSGEVVAATNRVADDLPKSNLFLQREETVPLPIVAVNVTGPEGARVAPYEQRPLEAEISQQLSRVIIGMKEGDRRAAEIRAEDAPGQDAHRYIARLRRVRTRPKEWKMPKGDYEFRAKRPPEVGQEFTYDPDFPGRVESVTDTEVIVRLFATPGAVIETPFGPGRIREEGRDYKMDIDARKGALVRAGDMTGRISDVDDRIITIDFGNAFGGETLLCDVTVGTVADAPSIASGE